jgi:transposase-like protein
MSKYSKDFKLRVIKHYLSGKAGLSTTATRFEIDQTDVSKWVRAFKIHGQKSLVKRYTNYTSPFKLSVLQWMSDQQLSIREAAAHFNIPSPSTIRVWQQLYNKGGIKALQSKPRGRPPMSTHRDIKELMAKPLKELSHEELLRKAQYLEIENAYLKKLEALAQQKILAKKNKSK